MAKQRREHTGASAMQTLLGAIEKVAEAELGDVGPEQRAEANRAGLEAVKQATGAIGESNIMTGLELQDDAIEAMHDADDATEADADQDAIEHADAMEQAEEPTEPTG